MSRRRAIAILALLGLIDSAYLLLHKLGLIGELACVNPGSCDLVNASIYSMFLGLPVAAYGVAGYFAILALALASVQPRWLSNPRFDVALAVLAGSGAAFSIYLTWMSVVRIRATCQWCLVSLAIILSIFALSLLGAVGREALRS